MDHQEALKISGKGSLDAAIEYFRGSPLKSFIITDGPDPVILYSKSDKDGRIIRMPVSGQLLKHVISGDSRGDTTGAGDNFAGGVIYSLAKQMQKGTIEPDLGEAVKWGIVSGGFACTYMGGTFLEEYPGQKKEAISGYFDLYVEQLKNG